VSVTYPRGFRAAGIAAGLKPSGKPDLGLLLGEPGTKAAGLFTTNLVAAAPVVLSRERLSGGAARAVVVNSGQANAATGARGAADAELTTAEAARALAIAPGEVLSCSTGVIGEPLHVERFLDAVPALASALSVEGGDGFAKAILTTDTVDKQATGDAGDVRVGGCAKGVGMIAPNLATMLSFLTTDAQIETADLRRLAFDVLRPRFNSFSVDGCASTNDTVLLFASGASGVRVRPGSGEWSSVCEALDATAESLVAQLISDGEGATHVLVIEVVGATTEADARAAAMAIADSPLVKAAAFGGDPNPGRFLQAVGSSGAAFDPGNVEVWIGDAQVAVRGSIPIEFFEPGSLVDRAKAAMKEPEIQIRVSLGDGPGRSKALGCDLSYEYVRINGEYTT
jgi:glutamate N-acetyltransferase / amino-acid N-acetyltransferase